ncbi:hypothetical protein STRIP9103_00117 [Streptomyces ipomoeae 91-03]|uniref:Uncharacterized protein n=1 Tax=Streptomyces ipomoeae 91-03 TaxID=698759 RepID=L1KV46_9ACTN|nr:hypothetical protein STRIP9103_00117 [Streptomyces ipomoeae 91-03]
MLKSLGHVNLRAPSGSITTLREDDFPHNLQVVSLGDTRHLERRGGARRSLHLSCCPES